MTYAQQQRLAQKLQSKGQPLWRTNWDFSQCPVQELMHACWYEYGRESEDFIRLAVSYRREIASSHLPLDESKLRKIWERKEAEFKLQIIRLCPEFPTAPWLDIKPSVRQQRMNEFGGGLATHQIVEPAFQELSPIGRSLTWDGMLQEWICSPQKPTDVRLTETRYCLVEVDFQRSNEDLQSDFMAWVKLNKECLKASPRQKRIDPRGRRDNPADLLRKLGAWRILRATGFTMDQVCGCDDFQRVYQNPEEWSKARAAAQAFLRRYFSKKAPTGVRPNLRAERGASTPRQ